MLASTIEPVVTGILDVLEQAYLQETGVTVRHIAAGSGQSIAMAKAGRVDVLLTHAPDLEKQFVSDGWGSKTLSVMRNDFILVGPTSDPAKVVAAKTVTEAFARIAQSEAVFVSRGDQSGTHLFELNLWQGAGISPSSPWYQEARNTLGNYGILRRAAELEGYTLVDRASYVTGYAGAELKVLFSRDPKLVNLFSVIPVSRKKAAVNQQAAEAFAEWLISPAAKRIISSFGKVQYGFSLFEPI